MIQILFLLVVCRQWQPTSGSNYLLCRPPKQTNPNKTKQPKNNKNQPLPTSILGKFVVQSVSHVQLFATPSTVACQASLSITMWCHPTISISVIPFSSCPQSFPASGSFPMSQLVASGGSKFWSFSFNISPSNEHPGLIFRMTGWISLQSKGLSRILSNTTVQKH